MSSDTNRRDITADMAALRDQRDEDIDLSDIPELTDASRAVIGKFYRPIKETGGDVTQLCDS